MAEPDHNAARTILAAHPSGPALLAAAANAGVAVDDVAGLTKLLQSAAAEGAATTAAESPELLVLLSLVLEEMLTPEGDAAHAARTEPADPQRKD